VRAAWRNFNLKAGVGRGKVEVCLKKFQFESWSWQWEVEGWLKLEICSAGVGHPITNEVSSVSPLGVQNLKMSLLLPFWISPLLLKRISEPQFKLHKLQRYWTPRHHSSPPLTVNSEATTTRPTECLCPFSLPGSPKVTRRPISLMAQALRSTAGPLWEERITHREYSRWSRPTKSRERIRVVSQTGKFLAPLEAYRGGI